jgi:hypothetical protein
MLPGNGVLGRAPEGWFAIDHPAVAEELAEKTVEDFGLCQGLELSVELKLLLLQGFDELATEDLAENCFRDKKVVAPGTNPVCAMNACRRERTPPRPAGSIPR